MHVLVALVCTETKLKSLKPQIRFACSWRVRKSVVQHSTHELWALIDVAVEIKFTIVISLLEWYSSLSTQRHTGKTLYLDRFAS